MFLNDKTSDDIGEFLFYVENMEGGSGSSSVVSFSTQDPKQQEMVGKCRVCGKQAAGLHYLVPTCHGCKSFFRRAYINKTVFKPCLYGSRCYSKIDSFNPPMKCRICRYEKCYEVGMVAHVMSEKKHFRLNSAEKARILENPITLENQMYEIIDKLLHLEVNVEKFRRSAFNPIIIPNLDELLFTESNLLSQADRYGPMPGWPLQQDDFCQKQKLINDAINNSSLADDKEILKCNSKEWLSFDMLTAIEYAKTFPFFHELPYSDRLLVAQATTFMNLALTSSFYSYSKKMGILQMPDGICISGPGGKNEKEVRRLEQKIGGRVIVPMIRENMEKVEYVLLKAMVLCNNAITDLSPIGQKILLRERHKYLTALIIHCKVSNQSPSRIYSILGLFDVLEHYQRDFRDFMICLDLTVPDRYAPKARRLQHEILRL